MTFTGQLSTERRVARVLRSHSRIERMATKMKIMKLLQEIRDFAQLTYRQPQHRQPGLFLIQLRSHLHHATAPRRRLIVPVDHQDPPDIPAPVKIIHVNGDAAVPCR